MSLALVRIVTATVHEAENVSVPELPVALAARWVQASSLFAGMTKILVFLPDATEEELDEIEEQTGAVIVYRDTPEETTIIATAIANLEAGIPAIDVRGIYRKHAQAFEHAQGVVP